MLPLVDDDTPPKLNYTVHNPTGHTTVVLIHGALVSGLYWDLVIPYLPSSYHLLVPDLPGHGKSQAITPFSVDLSVRLLADLIRTHATNGSANIIGHSLGAQIAIRLAFADPDVVYSVFVSGFGIFPRTALTPYMPYAAWSIPRVENCLPRSLLRWPMDSADLPRIDTNTCTLRRLQPTGRRHGVRAPSSLLQGKAGSSPPAIPRVMPSS